MSKARCVSLRSYRAFRFEIVDDGGLGWCVTIHPPTGMRPGGGGDAFSIRNTIPNGLAALLAAARKAVDSRVAHPDWRRAPEGSPRADGSRDPAASG